MQWWRVTIILGLALVSTAGAQLPRSEQGDADLNAVTFVGDRRAWAVGEHGAVWTSIDGGSGWQFVRLPLELSLQSVCFLTDRVGWVAGCRPRRRGDDSVAMATTDGGQTWRIQALPVGDVRDVVFFDLKHGVVVGQATASAPAGLAVTFDGGKSWKATLGEFSQGWRCAAFTEIASGVVAGNAGRLAPVFKGSLVPPAAWPQERWNWQDVALSDSGHGWLVGDAAAVLTRPAGQSSWETVPTPLPTSLREAMDFQGVAAVGASAWMVGAPGSIVWHTPDGGHTWKRQLTGQSVPLRAVAFSDKRHGIAVGSLGVILKTEDGGDSWSTVQGQGRRLALLGIHARPETLSLALIGRSSGEHGFRSRSIVVARSASDAGNFDTRLKSAVHEAGGSGLEAGWRWPLEIPDASANRKRLVEAWQVQSEGRFEEMLRGWVISLVRAWRPSVVVVDAADNRDALASVVGALVQRSVSDAGDATRWAVQSHLTGLRPWKVSKLYCRVPPGSQGDVSINVHEFLERSGEVLQERVARAATRAPGLVSVLTETESYRLLVPGEARVQVARGPRLFSGLGIRPDTAARRPLRIRDAERTLTGQRIARRRRGVAAYLQLVGGGGQDAETLMGQMIPLLQGLEPERAGWQLWSLSDRFRRMNRFDLETRLLVDLLRRNKDHEMAVVALQRLLILEGSEEMRWQRLRETRRDHQVVTSSPRRRRSTVNETVGESRSGVKRVGFTRVRREQSPLLAGRHGDWRKKRGQAEQDLAIARARSLRSRAARCYADPQTQLPLASLLRARGTGTLADSNLQGCRQRHRGGPWERVLQQEIWLARPRQVPPERMVSCRLQAQRPGLDGILSDECWQQAMELPLQEKEARRIGADYSFAQLAADQQFLYVAARLTKGSSVGAVASDRLQSRRHDAVLRGQDRVTVLIDTDRDYASWYQLEVDRRGQVAEACAGDRRWNPKCFVAVASDSEGWRVELAIPWAELVAEPPVAGEAWAVQVVRTEPGIGWQSWGATDQTVGFAPLDLGLLLFGTSPPAKPR